MLQEIRFSIARLMGVVLIMALGFAALRGSTEAWAGAMIPLTCGLLTLAAVGALCRGSHERAWWLGFALFGGGYLTLAHWMSFSNNTLPTITLVDSIGSGLGKPPTPWPRSGDSGWDSLPPTHRILHCLWALASALLGCILAGLLVASPALRAPGTAEETSPARRPSRPWWKQPVVIGLPDSGSWPLPPLPVDGRARGSGPA